MFSSKKPTMNSHERPPMCVQGDSGLVLTTDPKPRLRWTVELHDRFVDAIAQLGGPDKATPKTIMRVMGVKGLTLYHLKSHLQKFRLGKQPHKEFNDHSKDVLDMQRNGGFSSGIMSRNMNDRNVQITEALRMQKEVQRRLHEQLEVQKHLQMRIEAQGKYMQSILEKACQTLAGEGAMTATTGSYKDHESQTNMNLGAMAFPSLQDLHLFHNGQLGISSQFDRSLDDFFPSNEAICLGKKRPNPYSHANGKSPMIWPDALKLQEFGSHVEASKNNIDHEHLQIAPLGINGGMEMESMADHAYEAKTMLSSVDGNGEKYEGSLKLERPTSTPRRATISTPERMSPMIRGGGLGQTRNLSSYA